MAWIFFYFRGFGHVYKPYCIDIRAKKMYSGGS